MNRSKMITVLQIVLPLILALISIFVITGYASSVKTHAGTISSLDEKKSTVMELTATSAAASAAITVIPGDVATPIADKLADLSSYFLVVLSAIYLEKFLVTILGIAAFRYLIPAACIIFAANAFFKSDGLRRLAIKLALFGIVMYMVIPASVRISDLIDSTYSTSVQSIIDSAKEQTKEIENSTADSSSDSDNQGLLGKLISGVESTVSGITADFEKTLSNFVDAAAVMIVTSCIIPILVLLFFVWIVKILFSVDIRWPEGIKRLG